jgi:hypothetical protein
MLTQKEIRLFDFIYFFLGSSRNYGLQERANGVRYPLVGGTRQRHFTGINFQSHKLPENAPTPTGRVHAVLGAHC